jgi:single-strand DNA-binding protein
LDGDGALASTAACDATAVVCWPATEGSSWKWKLCAGTFSEGRMQKWAERSVNKAILLGRLGGDAETRHTQNGTPVSRVSLAMNRQWMDSEKQVHEETDWIYIVLWNKENLAAYLTKGAKVYVEGRIQTRSYEDDSGVKRYVTEVVTQNIVLLGSSGNANGKGAERAEKSGDRPARGKRVKGRSDRPPIPKNRVSKMTF